MAAQQIIYVGTVYIISCIYIFFFVLLGQNYEGIQQKRWPSTLILLITPPPIDEVQRIRHPYVENPLGLPERTNEAAGAFAKACVETAGECGISVVDLWTRMQHYPDWRNAFLRYLTLFGF
ncbi:hypothetical protein E1A91_D06G158500v1 [Gossypium mustelinum]|uniref:Uncharacterized protein n=1 Tax=Gossypium mustelinum TaxID=34275 RepID=A0A5D2UMC6_GOSMU|nr:hypothetical protein E1A91_D06G158500v1 [Gossypium mustelinum]